MRRNLGKPASMAREGIGGDGVGAAVGVVNGVGDLVAVYLRCNSVVATVSSGSRNAVVTGAVVATTKSDQSNGSEM